MDSLGNNTLIGFYLNFDIFLLVVIRLIGFFSVSPVISSTSIPNRAKIAFAVAVAYIIFVSGKVDEVFYYDNIPGYVFLVFQEFFAGVTIGTATYIVFSVLFFAGQLMDQQIGFAMVNVLNPVTQIQVPVTGNLFYFFMSLLLIQAGGLHAFIATIFHSYEVLPIGVAKVLTNGELLVYFIELLATYFTLGVKIAFPIVGAILVIDIVLGIMVKAVPKLNVFVVGMPLKVLSGLALLYAILPAYAQIYNAIFDKSLDSILFIIRSMMP